MDTNALMTFTLGDYSKTTERKSDETIIEDIMDHLKTMYGNIDFSYGDYLIIPRGTVYQIDFKDENNRLLYLESFNPIYTPSRYRNHFGQHLESSPFCERDIRVPQNLETHDEKGSFLVKMKKENKKEVINISLVVGLVLTFISVCIICLKLGKDPSWGGDHELMCEFTHNNTQYYIYHDNTFKILELYDDGFFPEVKLSLEPNIWLIINGSEGDDNPVIALQDMFIAQQDEINKWKCN